jgi:hypothetical protein
MLFLGGTLFIFRSRVWPPFFSIGYEELAGVSFGLKQFQNAYNAVNNPGARQFLAPMLETIITKQMFLKDEGNMFESERTQSFGSDDAVIILNPTKYTLIQELEEREEEDRDK